MDDTIRVRISGLLGSGQYSQTEVSSQTMEVRADRGHAQIAAVMGSMLRAVEDQMQAERIHRDAMARLVRVLGAKPAIAEASDD